MTDVIKIGDPKKVERQIFANLAADIFWQFSNCKVTEKERIYQRQRCKKTNKFFFKLQFLTPSVRPVYT
jgi:hypothetical protein